jgi:predicted TIM-barrel enzyme
MGAQTAITIDDNVSKIKKIIQTIVKLPKHHNYCLWLFITELDNIAYVISKTIVIKGSFGASNMKRFAA